jgi:hypothetical protein
MKMKLIVICICFIFPSLLFAQQGNEYEETLYLFDNFEKGTAFLKSGITSQNNFNYEMITGQMLFLENGVVMEMADPSSVAKVIVAGRDFENVGKEGFCEYFRAGNLDLYVKWKGVQANKGESVGFGAVLHGASVYKVDKLRTDGFDTKRLNASSGYVIKNQDVYYIRIKGKLKRFNSVNSLAKLFKGHENEIKQEAQTRNIDFSDVEGVKHIVEFCGRYANGI